MNDTITLPRSVVEQALKALEKADRISGYRNNRAAVNSLIAALEQPQGDPVGWLPLDCRGGYNFQQPPVVEQPQGTRHETAIPDKLASQAIDALASYCNTGEIEGADDLLASLLYSIEHSQQPQVEQEPVAWQGRDGYLYHFIEEPKPGDHPLYTHPQPPRQPLTDDQIGEIEGWFSNEFGLEAKHSIDFARAIEAAHGITGEQE